MVILIPAYEPDIRLLELIIGLKENIGADILIVDDGSGQRYSSIFSSLEEFGCKVLRHEANKGKGRALKTGFEYLIKSGEGEGVVSADCDGQHLPQDIIKIAGEMKENKNCILLGSRHFAGKVPLKSRFGNMLTRNTYSLVSGKRIEDTQTGLRGYPAELLPWLCSIPGERFEYEMNTLLQSKMAGIDIREIEINTVYLENNRTSHFRPFADSSKVYLPIFKFAAFWLLCGAVDFSLLLLLYYFTRNLAVAVVGSRLSSTLCKVCLNRDTVFTFGKGRRESFIGYKYFSLVLVVLVFNYMFMAVFYQLAGLNLILSKVLTEIVLYLLRYWTQKRYIFT